MLRESFFFYNFFHKIFSKTLIRSFSGRYTPGFLLIELVIALAIFSLFAFSIMRLQITVVRAHDIAYSRIQTLTKALYALEARDPNIIDQKLYSYEKNKNIISCNDTDTMVQNLRVFLKNSKKKNTINLPEVPIMSLVTRKKCLTGESVIALAYVIDR